MYYPDTQTHTGPVVLPEAVNMVSKNEVTSHRLITYSA